MTNVLILGANGATAKIVTDRLLAETTDHLFLFLRHSQRLSHLVSHSRVTLIEGDVLNEQQLTSVMANSDIVYSNIGGTELGRDTAAILKAMHETHQSRLIFYSALGALHEVPGAFGTWNEQAIASYLPGFRKANELIKQDMTIDVTQIRPAWLTDRDEIDYEVTGENEPFKGTEISRQSVADFVVKLIKNPDQYHRTSVGLNKPHTEGTKPSWF